MAHIFEQYLIYRPHWIQKWELEKNIETINENDQWQITLWKDIIQHTENNHQSTYHYAHLLYQLESLIKTGQINKQYLPKRFFIISSLSLNPFHINFFKKISNFIKIYFLYITPCKQKTSQNSLIKLWGKNESFYDLYISNCKKTKFIKCFSKKQCNNLLNYIKNDLLEDKTSKKKRTLQLNDNSISINICCNKRHEIEILYQKLLNFFSEDSDISPSDIVVTSFSIDDYISYIESIFLTDNNKKNIPFFINTQFSKKTEIILSVFNKLLNLSNSRFENEEILELFDIPEIAKHFNISDEDISILHSWIEETNIRWGLDKQHKKNFLLPGNKQNTWFYGIEKLLLSYAMNDTKKNWNNVLACSIINGSRAELVGKLIVFINILKKWQYKLSKLNNLRSWYSISHDMINDFFFQNQDIAYGIEIINKKWKEMLEDISFSHYNEKISIEILKQVFIYKIKSFRNKQFSPGAVNFCHPSSIHLVPFKIICFIGLDSHSVPDETNVEQFNLLKKYPLIGDFNLNEQYSYIFLQNLSCAKQYFYISYVGYSMQDNSKIYPSILIEQLLNYISLHFYFIEDESFKLENNLQKITMHLCKKYKKEYLYKNNYVDNGNVKYTTDQLKPIKKHTNNQKLLKHNLCNTINLIDFIQFWRNPIQHFCNNYLKIKFKCKKQAISITEPFFINKLDTYKIKTILLDKIIKNEDTIKIFEYYMLSGKLPYNFFGIVLWNNIIQEMQSIANVVKKTRNLNQQRQININIQDYHISGVLSEIQSTGLLRWQPNTIKYSDRMSLWIEHLLYCITGGTGNSTIIGYKKQKWSFSSLDSDSAYNYLLRYIKGYIKGSKKILLLTKSGASWLDKRYDIKNNYMNDDDISKKQSYKKLLECWLGNNYIKGEKEDFYIQQIINTLSKKNVKTICQTAQKWLIPLLKNKHLKK